MPTAQPLPSGMTARASTAARDGRCFSIRRRDGKVARAAGAARRRRGRGDAAEADEPSCLAAPANQVEQVLRPSAISTGGELIFE
jgi:hypothetical protein